MVTSEYSPLHQIMSLVVCLMSQRNMTAGSLRSMVAQLAST